MANQLLTRKSFFVFAGVSLLALLGAGSFSSKSQQPKRSWPQEPRVTSMPQVFSKIKSLEVVRTWIQDIETGYPSAAVEIRNNSNKDMCVVDLLCGEGGITRNGVIDEEHPVVV